MALTKLIKIKDRVHPDAFYHNKTIGVNIEQMWNSSIMQDFKNYKKRKSTKKSIEDIFTRRFAEAYEHELLHQIIEFVMNEHYDGDWYFYEEERCIYALQHRKWTKSIDRYYENFYANQDDEDE